MPKKLMYPVRFSIVQVTPDPRPYNQQRQIYNPDDPIIQVEIEVNKENFYLTPNLFEKIKLAELGSGNMPKVPENLIFTPLGWKRVMEKLEEPYKEEMEEDGQIWTTEDDEEEFTIR